MAGELSKVQDLRMTVTQAMARRQSVRAFTAEPVDAALLHRLVQMATQAPSGGNLQPWRLYVLTGETRDRLARRIAERIAGDPALALKGDGGEYAIYPDMLPAAYAERRRLVGAALHASLGIARDDRAERLRQVARNYDFFGAPVGILVTIERSMQPGQYADLGLFMQSLALLAVEAGLGTCMQEAWSLWHATIRECIPAVKLSELVFCGIALGHPDAAAPVNGWRAGRAPLAEVCSFLD